MAVTNWMVLPARRVIPGLFGHDLASLLLAWFWQLAYFLVAVTLSSGLNGVSPAPTGRFQTES
jgi:YggT family protein